MTTQATTEYTARVTYKDGDFMAEVVVWEDGQIVDEIHVGWFDTYALAHAAATEDTTDCIQRQANEAAMAEALLEAQIAQIDATIAELAEDANSCECCGAETDADAAELVGAEMHCPACVAGAGFEEYANDGTEGTWVDPADAQSGWAMLDTPAARRDFRDTLVAQGAVQDAAMDAAEVEAWLREQPSDMTALRLEICAISGDHIVVDQFGRVVKRECDGAAAYLWLCEMQEAWHA